MFPSPLTAASVLPMLAGAAVLIAASAAQARAVPGPEPRRDCSGDPGWRVVACEALRDALPLAEGAAPCPNCALRPRGPAP
jgi:hypothetical protein